MIEYEIFLMVVGKSNKNSRFVFLILLLILVLDVGYHLIADILLSGDNTLVLLVLSVTILLAFDELIPITTR